jgi:hypothetical protein
MRNLNHCARISSKGYNCPVRIAVHNLLHLEFPLAFLRLFFFFCYGIYLARISFAEGGRVEVRRALDPKIWASQNHGQTHEPSHLLPEGSRHHSGVSAVGDVEAE